jgi:hypothetical protein
LAEDDRTNAKCALGRRSQTEDENEEEDEDDMAKLTVVAGNGRVK